MDAISFERMSKIDPVVDKKKFPVAQSELPDLTPKPQKRRIRQLF